MRKTYLFCITSLVCVITICCNKGSNESRPPDLEFIEIAKHYFENEVVGTIPNNSSTSAMESAMQTGHPVYKNIERNPVWENAVFMKLSVGAAVVVPVEYKTPWLIHSNFSGGAGYSINSLTRLLIYKDSLHNFHAEMLTHFPDSNYIDNSAKQFTGIVLVEDWAGKPVNRYKFERNGSIKKYRPTVGTSTPSLNASRALNGNLQSVEICYEVSGYNYAPDDPGSGHYWTLSLGCTTFYVNDDGGNPSGYDYGPVGIVPPGGTGGGGGGGISPSPSFILVDGDNIIPNITQYINCFINTPGYNHNFNITLCVSQPEVGSRESWSFAGGGSSGTGSPVTVGHVFFILNETSSIGNITRNIGFYPASSVNPSSPISQGQLNNDVYHDYDVAVNISVTNSQFFQVLNFIQQGNNPGYLYNLNTNNCTTFALNALSGAGINLPRTPGSWLNGGGLNPGDLGEDLRTMDLPSNMTRTTLSGTHPNAGFCY